MMTLRELGDSLKNLGASAKDTSEQFGNVLTFNVNWLDAPIYMIVLAIPLLLIAFAAVCGISVTLFRSLGISTGEGDDSESDDFIDIMNPRWHQSSSKKRVLLVTIYGALGLLISVFIIAPIILAIRTIILSIT